MLRRRLVQEESCQKEFGELFTIHKPYLISPSASESDEDTVELRYDLPPELPCHVPTPKTINNVEGCGGGNGKLGGILQTMFSEDSQDSTLSSRERRRWNLLNATPASSDESVYACGKLQILITSPVSTKWGPDIWNSLKTNNRKSSRKGLFSNPKRTNSDSAAGGEGTVSTPKQGRLKKMRGSPSRPPSNKRPKSPSSPVGRTSGAETSHPQTPPKINAKLILSEETVETVFVAPTVSSNNKNNTSSYTNKKTRLASPLQRKWMQENALNLYSSCQRDCGDEDRVSSRRSSFLRLRTPAI